MSESQDTPKQSNQFLRILLLIPIVGILGVVVGNAGTAWEFSSHDEIFESHNGSDEKQPAGTFTGAPKAKILGGNVEREPHVFDFGVMERHATRYHKFKIKNEGEAPLKIDFTHESCAKCISANFSSAIVPPGSEVAIPLEYSTHKEAALFTESVTLVTNDVNNAKIVLQIRGEVVQAVRVAPNRLVLSNVIPSDSEQYMIRIFSFVPTPIEVDKHEFLRAETAEQFEVSIEPMTREQVREEKRARTGIAVKVKLKPGLPLGPLSQILRLTTNIADSEELEIPIEGTIVSEISVFGANYMSDYSVLSLGTVKQSKGFKRKLHILVKGDSRETTNFKVREMDPPGYYQVQLNKGKSTVGSDRYELTIEVPPGSEPINKQSAKRSEMGKIVLDTGSPKTPTLPIYIQVAVDAD